MPCTSIYTHPLVVSTITTFQPTSGELEAMDPEPESTPGLETRLFYCWTDRVRPTPVEKVLPMFSPPPGKKIYPITDPPAEDGAEFRSGGKRLGGTKSSQTGPSKYSPIECQWIMEYHRNHATANSVRGWHRMAEKFNELFPSIPRTPKALKRKQRYYQRHLDRKQGLLRNRKGIMGQRV